MEMVGLFKNGVLIDVIGTFNGGAQDFAMTKPYEENQAFLQILTLTKQPNGLYAKDTYVWLREVALSNFICYLEESKYNLPNHPMEA
jgi:hypothetical protein